MKANFLLSSMAIFVFLLGTGCQPAQAETPTPTTLQTVPHEQTITIGVISSDPAKAIASFQMLANYLAIHLGDEGILKGEVLVTTDLETMTTRLKTGEVDLFFESPYGASQVYQTGAIPLLRRWKGGISEYYTVIVVRKDSGLSTIEQLKGKNIAFEDIGSTSGHLLPKAYLSEKGFTLSEKTDSSSPVNANEIGYFFTGAMENSLALVLRSKITAAAIQSDVFEKLPQEDKDQLSVLAQTIAVPRHITLASPQLDTKTREKIIDVLLEMENSEEGKEVLKATEKTTRFDLFPMGAEETMQTLLLLFSNVR